MNNMEQEKKFGMHKIFQHKLSTTVNLIFLNVTTGLFLPLYYRWFWEPESSYLCALLYLVQSLFSDQWLASRAASSRCFFSCSDCSRKKEYSANLRIFSRRAHQLHALTRELACAQEMVVFFLLSILFSSSIAAIDSAQADVLCAMTISIPGECFSTVGLFLKFSRSKWLFWELYNDSQPLWFHVSS